MPWISLIGMFTHVLLPRPLKLGRVCLNFCLAGLIHLTLRHLNCLHFCVRQMQIPFPDL